MENYNRNQVRQLIYSSLKDTERERCFQLLHHTLDQALIACPEDLSENEQEVVTKLTRLFNTHQVRDYNTRKFTTHYLKDINTNGAKGIEGSRLAKNIAMRQDILAYVMHRNQAALGKIKNPRGKEYVEIKQQQQIFQAADLHLQQLTTDVTKAHESYAKFKKYIRLGVQAGVFVGCIGLACTLGWMVSLPVLPLAIIYTSWLSVSSGSLAKYLSMPVTKLIRLNAVNKISRRTSTRIQHHLGDLDKNYDKPADQQSKMFVKRLTTEKFGFFSAKPKQDKVVPAERAVEQPRNAPMAVI